MMAGSLGKCEEQNAEDNDEMRDADEDGDKNGNEIKMVQEYDDNKVAEVA